MRTPSTKPYLIRAIQEWCADNGLTPHLAVKVDAATRVPTEYVKNGEIVLNIGVAATHRLTIDNDIIRFSGRFGGVSRECSIPVEAVSAIFARENGQGISFESQSTDAVTAGDEPRPPDEPPTTPAASGRP
ncbi:MAG: ClpXP protease specificity-enhancing factor, partial [Burkholderiales bacterium]